MRKKEVFFTLHQIVYTNATNVWQWGWEST